MICEERTETKHAGKTSIISMLRHPIATSQHDTLTTPHNATEWLQDKQLCMRIWQARSLWQIYDPIQAGHLPPK
jgi:hypothetical protein